ncbi:hypothetical protein A2313_04420 [Candidatus Roizmanbacteria bacterium RIFOXYB2_FULL_41_10]|uniref:Uncharacterized protein n=1 Tax=Candidatus Roizmanbacteria bacterium RIFOXYA1_FULL_41_12 TaxID=1802082 RepID=A0A1F7KAG9_9BACT|nr:MAG: hypothetical protein A2209_04020 [Candidatus Roizmanbacteria bacterium RIFOXYA1_FULL_41_12]OGK66225.1 MAG: hypothetical protein A2262_02250 [Candidatus Roizmanbacteria bacterium RIFOXYA2_FULL_41_8]OGK66899.1 MAG: hypothetical protein A2377_03305 [Candidatus Roizmanbacteria bacterium RIFOXYB1_FULL_41_27]OGK70727.1 MAG: hypothetical protein A2403_01400 [Candidatus Roizmanbacteria bacterium RIFOXYC1_FULL_41_16]OGK71572.1 MAG: hypothetical protein A2313_04420 [Candidatus Roizmanbacteria bac
MKNKLTLITVVGIFAALIIIALKHATWGIDFWDEGFYVATAMRYAFGDIPFLDEFATHIYSFDKLMAPLFILFPKITLFQVRVVGIGFNFLSLFFLYQYLSRFGPRILVSLLVVALFFINNFAFIASPSYNSGASNFILLSFLCFMYSLEIQRLSQILAVFSGLFLLFATISYLSQGAMIAIPIFFYVAIRIGKKPQYQKFLRPLKLLVITFFAGLSILFILLYTTELLPVFIKGIMDQSSKRDIGAGLATSKIQLVYFWFVSALRNGFALVSVLGLSLGIIWYKTRNKLAKFSLVDLITSLGLSLFLLPTFIPIDPSFITRTLPLLFFLLFLLIVSAFSRKYSRLVSILLLLGYLGGLLYHPETAATLGGPIQALVPLSAFLFFFYSLRLVPLTVFLSLFLFIFFKKTDEALGILHLTNSFAISSCLLLITQGIWANNKKGVLLDSWRSGLIAAFVWFTGAGLIFSFSSFSGYSRMIQGAAPLFAFAFVGIWRMINNYWTKTREVAIHFSWQIPIFGILLLFLSSGFKYYFFQVNNEYYDRATAKFKYPPTIAGIYSTPQKVEAIEDLMFYLKGKVNPGDYFLTYYYDPLLYFITKTRPSYREVLAQEDYTPYDTRVEMVRNIKLRNKMPNYVVKFMVHQGSVFKNPVHNICENNERCPIDVFVSNNYYVEKSLYPFEVWHRGKGPKLKLWQTQKPIWEVDLNDFLSPYNSSLFFSHQNFAAFLKVDKAAFIHIVPDKNRSALTLSYVPNTLQKINVKAGDRMVLTVRARIGRKEKEYNAIRGYLYINEELPDGIEKNDIAISTPGWDEYIVSKKIRNLKNPVEFVLQWLPGSSNDYLDIEWMRLYLESRHN